MRNKRRLCQYCIGVLLLFIAVDLLSTWKSAIQPGDSKGGRKREENIHDTSVDILGNYTSLKLYEKFESKPFEAGSPKMVVVMTYQRSGSSFFGEIFDRNPKAFYVYEPLDSLYTSLYGTGEGWNVPSDITSFWNGSERIPPQDDIDAAAAFLDNLLNCKTDAVPTEFFRHRYWAMMTKSFQSGQQAYRACTRQLKYNIFKCSSILANVTCPKRIGGDWDKLINCKENLLNTLSMESHFQAYKACNKEVRNKLEACIPILKKNCTDAEIRATKTVRATMGSMETLLAHNPNMRVIYLVRDPRGVVLSRMKYHSSRGTYSKDDYVQEAKIFCRSTTRDLRLLKVLQDVYPGKIIQVIYDDFVKDPLEYTKAIYRFLGASIPQPTMDWLVTNTQVKRNSTLIAVRWQSKIPYRNVILINKYCEDYMKEIDYPWD